MPAHRRTVSSVLNKLIERVNSNMRRLRVLEQESSVYKTRMNSVEEDLLSQRNETENRKKELVLEKETLEERLTKIENVLKEIVSQLKKVTTTTKIKELEQLIEVYNPIKSQFMTRDEVDQMIDERLKGR